MAIEFYSLTPINLALDGSLELFVELYEKTQNIYLELLKKDPDIKKDQKRWDELARPQLLPEFNHVLWKRLRLFTKAISFLQFTEKHFARFMFLDEQKIRSFEYAREFELAWIARGFMPLNDRHLKRDDPLFEFRETVISLEKFVGYFKLMVFRAVYDELRKSDPSYTIFRARKEVEDCICERIKMRRDECIIPNNPKHPPTEKPLFLYHSLKLTGCRQNSHCLETRKYYARHIDGKNTVVLPAHYCKTCGRYLFGATSLSFFKESCGQFIVRTDRSYLGPAADWYSCGESELHRLGYNVINGQLSLTERRNILVGILEGRQLSFFEIVATLEQNIRVFGNHNKMQAAVGKWKSDLMYINEYMLQQNQAL